jgi:hypothetical protein
LKRHVSSEIASVEKSMTPGGIEKKPETGWRGHPMKLTAPFPFWKGTSRLQGEQNAICSGFFEDGRKEWARRHAAFPLIWAEFAKFRGNRRNREET